MDEEWSQLEALIAEYDRLYGRGEGHEIAGSLMFSHGISGILAVFKKANGRRIVLEVPDDMIDVVIVKYKKTGP